MRLPFLALALAAAALAATTPASAENALGPTVDDALAALVATADPAAPVDLVVYGPPAALTSLNEKYALAPTNRLDEISAESLTTAAGQIPALAAEPGITYVTADLPAAPTAVKPRPATSAGTTTVTPTPTPTLATLYPAIDGAQALWPRPLTGAGVGIAVIDSGVSPFPDFGSRLTATSLTSTDAGDTIGHGTLVASIAAGSSSDGRFVGIAPSAAIYSLKVSRGKGVNSSDVAAALAWVMRENAKQRVIRVVVLALSEIVASSHRSSALDAMIDKLWSSGVVVVVSAGNTGPGTAQYAPANDPFAISVGSTDNAGTLATGDDVQTSWTTSGITPDGFAKPDILAPGRLIGGVLPAATTLGAVAPAANVLAPNYAAMSGTSFSAPQVGGAVALILQAHKAWTPDQVKWVLTTTARPVPGATAGALDVAAAVDYTGTVAYANQGLVPSTYGSSGWTTTQYRSAQSSSNSWTSNSWTSNSWNGNSWNSNSWNGSSWNSNSWNSNSWSSNSWSSYGS